MKIWVLSVDLYGWRTPVKHAAAAVVLGAIAVLSSCRSGMRVSDSVVPVRCSELRFPEPWEPPLNIIGDKEDWNKSGGYYLRESAAGEVLIAHGTRPESLSMQIYATSPPAKWRMRRVTKQEWDAGRSLGSKAGGDARDVQGEAELDVANRTVRLRGRTLKYSGKTYTRSFRSPSKKLLTVTSYSGSVPANLFHELPRWASGEYYIDLFDLETGRRLAAIEGSYRDAHPESYLLGVFWAGDRFLVRSVDYNREAPVICEIGGGEVFR